MTGTRHRSLRALQNIKRICEHFLKGRYELEVIDLYQQPALAAREQVIASPTLVKQLPLPPRRVIGDMSDVTRVLRGLELPQPAALAAGSTLPHHTPPENNA
jgi:circadian clock protein KaiB